MDFAFAPGITGYDAAIRQMFTNRASTTLIQQTGINTITDFINLLPGKVTSPLGNIFIGSHGSETAYIKAAFDIMSPHTTFESLDNALKPPRTGQLPDNIINPRPVDINNNPIPPHLYIRGCRIGILTPFIQKIKDVINGLSTTPVKVGAPLFFHAVTPLPQGIVESFSYDFHIFTKTKITNRAALLAAFTAVGFVDMYGNTITAAQWNSWLPRAIFTDKENFLFPKLVGSPLTSRQKFAAGFYRYRDASAMISTVFPPVGIDPSFGTIPTNKVQLTALIKTVIKAIIANPTSQQKEFAAQLVSTHPLPYYIRYEYISLDDMIDNLVWTGTPASRIYKGSRFEYYAGPPVVDNNANNELIFNFYPTAGKGGIASTMFADDASIYFNVV
jgi:hypothetical protein